MASFGAVVRPVSATMLLASFFVVLVRVETGSLVVYDDDDGSSEMQRLGNGAANALIVVAALIVATLGVLALYRFNCTVLLKGYMMLSSGLLLGLLGGVLVLASLEELGMKFTDLVSFSLGAYNGAALGVVAIYVPEHFGLPRWSTQCATVAVAVVMAWQLSHYPPVTSWCLLVALALYDLFAVLSPCGPLKWLVSMMHERGEALPGLLYEADLDDADAADDGLDPDAALEDPVQEPLKEQERAPAQRPADDDDQSGPNTVKLGLGDFVFYSVLVSNAFSSHVSTGAACYVVVTLGLGFTFFLLALYRMPLPALPISILAGVSSYFVIEFCVLPLIDDLADVRIFV